ncbi:MAG: DUF2244 domain-containing protein [Pseudomonadota bacterium]
MMDTNSALSEEFQEPQFVAELTPHRSLGKTGFVLLMVFVSLTCFISGLMFLVIGAWPVFMFMGLDILIVFAAFKLNYRDGRRVERISVSRNALKVEKVDPSGKIHCHQFNPFWTRFEVDRHEEYGILSMKLISREASLVIGSFLNPEDRASFANAFNHALINAKQ